MIYLATIHWKTDRWINIQQKYIKRYISDRFKIYASLYGIDKKYYSKFNYVYSNTLIDHGEQLNYLAERITKDSNDDNDIIVFIDGDAFPISELSSYINNKLRQYPLIAIQRRENEGDRKPHPSFCATTVGFWKRIKGDWERGYLYQNDAGKMITDIGAILYEKLRNENVIWHPLLRTNKINFHSVMFGIYDDMVYHHGAGFREPCLRSELDNNYNNTLLNKIISIVTDNLTQKIKDKYNPVYKVKKEIIKKNQVVSNKIFRWIIEDEFFFEKFK